MGLEDSDLVCLAKELDGLIETYLKENERVHETYKAKKAMYPENHWLGTLLDAICMVKDEKS